MKRPPEKKLNYTGDNFYESGKYRRTQQNEEEIIRIIIYTLKVTLFLCKIMR